MQTKIIILLIVTLFCASCNKLPKAVGNNNEIIIVSSESDKEYVSIYLDEIFNEYINTPIEENVFDLKYIKPKQFSKYKHYKNIIITSLVHPKDDTIDVLYEKFSNSYDNKEIFSLNNLYAENQIVLLIGAYDSIDFLKKINNYKNWVYTSINENVELNILNAYMNRKMNLELIDLVNNDFKISLNIDEDYKIIKKTNNFLWFGRGFPYRWLMFFKTSKTNNQNYWQLFTDELYANTNAIKISDYYMKEYKVDEKILLRGIYEHEVSDTGGPFFVYIFDNIINNEVILIAGLVNNPGKNKYDILKEMEIIVKNIKGIKK